MKKFLLISVFVFVLNACERPARPAGLPEPTLSANGVNLEVITGSSCYGAMCIDTIAPWELLGKAGKVYVSVDSGTLMMKSDTEIDSAFFDVMDVNGEGLSCVIESERMDGKSYTLRLCDDLKGEVLLHMGLHFEKGSVEYYAALSLE